MAELLVAGGGIVPSSLGAYLRETLPDAYIVVSDPIIHRHEIGAIVVGQAGLTVLHAVYTADHAADDLTAASAAAVSAGDAVRAFVAEEFPSLDFPIRALPVVAMVGTRQSTWVLAGTAGTSSETNATTLAQVIVVSDANPTPDLADRETRETLAVALRDRQITPSQRTTQPFVFRSGGMLGVDKQAWTVQDAVLHMDKYPADGIFHLANHTLERWLEAEGAPHLARLAEAAAAQCHDNRREGLEMFLVSTGLVKRPAPMVRPRQLDLGYILTGESASARLSIRKRPDRGYLFGNLSTGDVYVSAEPRVFHGDRVRAAITVDTESLLIRPEPYETQVNIYTGSRASAPLAVPVRFRVMAMPSPFSRYLGRPLIGLLIGGVMGGLVGWLWGLAALPQPGDLLAWTNFGPAVFWIALFAILWATLGAIRGLMQPPAWPVRYALVRWMLSVGIWVGALGLFGAVAVWCWNQGFMQGEQTPATMMWTAGFYGAALAALPAALQEILIAQKRSDLEPERSWSQVGRWASWAVASAGLLLTLFIAPAIVRQAKSHMEWHGTLQNAEGLMEAGWSWANRSADELMRQFYLLYYDRRAPLSPKSESSAPKSTYSRSGSP